MSFCYYKCVCNSSHLIALIKLDAPRMGHVALVVCKEETNALLACVSSLLNAQQNVICHDLICCNKMA